MVIEASSPCFRLKAHVALAIHSIIKQVRINMAIHIQVKREGDGAYRNQQASRCCYQIYINSNQHKTTFEIVWLDG